MECIEVFKQKVRGFELLLDKWYNEIDQLQDYKEKTKLEGKPTTFIDIRLNNNLERIGAVQELIQAAANAISVVPKQEKYNDLEAPQIISRVQLKDLPATSPEKMINTIYTDVDIIKHNLNYLIDLIEKK